ncbi:GAF domain-containing sensor histidine kinase [Richelia sinica]|nr:ATP-binding protein [Richelia sinica]MBD2663573.1 GAF domain-containing protein [Richelia sinica FACHB-800]
MKKRFLSAPQYIDNDVVPKHSYPLKLMQHQAQNTHALAQQITQIIAKSTATALMLEEIAELLGVAFQADACCLVTIGSESITEGTTGYWCSEKHLKLVQPQPVSSADHLLIKMPVVQCASDKISIEDIANIQKCLLTGCQNLPAPIQAVLAVHTRFGEENNGVICLIKFHSYEWNESEKQLLKDLESCCAIAFAHAIQSHTITNQQQYLHKTNQHQSLIKQLTILSRSNLELNQMLQLVIGSTAEALQADRGLLILLKYTDPLFINRPKKQIPKAKATVVGEWVNNKNLSRTSQDNTLEQSFWLADCGLCQRIFTESGKPIMINDCTDGQDNYEAAPLFAINEFPATLLMPLENQGRILGFVVLQQTFPRTWQPSELNLIEMLCAQISNAIIQSQTLRQVQNLVDERTEQLKRSLEVQSKLYERTKQYVEQLQQLNELKDEFVSNISDRLRYPLTNMLMSIRNLRLPGIPPERQTRYLDILEEECTKEITLINDLLTLQKLESHQEAPQLETIDLNSTLEAGVQTCLNKLKDPKYNIVVDLPETALELQTEVESFERILQELLNNACKYSEKGSTVHLKATHQVIDQLDQIMIKVVNTGRGISDEEAAYIFDKFRRGKGRWIPGTGLGLALVKSLVQHLNGAIAVESTPIPNSQLSEICFTLTLPQFSDHSPSNSEQ